MKPYEVIVHEINKKHVYYVYRDTIRESTCSQGNIFQGYLLYGI